MHSKTESNVTGRYVSTQRRVTSFATPDVVMPLVLSKNDSSLESIIRRQTCRASCFCISLFPMNYFKIGARWTAEINGGFTTIIPYRIWDIMRWCERLYKSHNPWLFLCLWRSDTLCLAGRLMPSGVLVGPWGELDQEFVSIDFHINSRIKVAPGRKNAP